MLKNSYVSMMDKFEVLAKQEYPNYIGVKESLCLTCSECCNDSVDFWNYEVKDIKKKYKKLFKGVIVESAHEIDPEKVRLRKRKNTGTEYGNNPCVFLDVETLKCKVYDVRPDICRRYGSSPIVPCGYEELDVLPEMSERIKLRKDANIQGKDIFTEVETAFRLGISNNLGS